MKYRCKMCSSIVDTDEKELWGHLQFFHRETFEEELDEGIIHMLDECYEPVREIWARIGISCYLSKEEIAELEPGKNGEMEINEKVAEIFKKKGRIDGESYIPDGCI